MLRSADQKQRKRTLKFVESFGRKDRLNIHTVFLVRVRKYSRKQVNRTVLWVLWRTGAITHEFLGVQPKI